MTMSRTTARVLLALLLITADVVSLVVAEHIRPGGAIWLLIAQCITFAFVAVLAWLIGKAFG